MRGISFEDWYSEDDEETREEMEREEAMSIAAGTSCWFCGFSTHLADRIEDCSRSR